MKVVIEIFASVLHFIFSSCRWVIYLTLKDKGESRPRGQRSILWDCLCPHRINNIRCLCSTPRPGKCFPQDPRLERRKQNSLDVELKSEELLGQLSYKGILHVMPWAGSLWHKRGGTANQEKPMRSWGPTFQSVLAGLGSPNVAVLSSTVTGLVLGVETLHVAVVSKPTLSTHNCMENSSRNEKICYF